MKRLLRILFIGAILALIAYNLFRSTCPPAEQIISHWEKNTEEYNAGKISFDELIYRSDRLIECSEKLLERLENQPSPRQASCIAEPLRFFRSLMCLDSLGCHFH